MTQDTTQVRSASSDTAAGRSAPRPALAGVARVLVGVLAVWALWDLARLAGILPTSQVPSAETAVAALARGLVDGDLLTPTTQTLVAFVAGLAAAIAIGVPAGFLVGRSRVMDDALGLTVDLLRPIPAVALVPVAVVVLGLGLQMQVTLVAFAAVWPIFFNTRYGVRNVDGVLIDAARLSGLGRTSILRRVVLPASLPAIMTGVRLSASIAVVLTVVTELVASGTGLGYYVVTNQQNDNQDQAFAAILLAALLGTAVNGVVRLVENRATRWHIERQELS